MSKLKHKKISISEFISDKKLKRLEKIIDESPNNEEAMDKIENLLIDDYKAKGIGTNRLILLPRNKKYKNLIVKVAADSHGIEANRRELFNGDLDEKRLTIGYSISKNGIFLVEERVTPFTSKMMKEHKKEVREMLKHLEPKLLLVDCKLSNFANFGIRDNGDIVLLDHGDTVPLVQYRNGEILNIVEESNVSLRCKDPKKGTLGSKNPEPCDGKLKYDKNYEYFVCKKCGSKSPINNAYKEFYAYSRVGSSGDNKFLTNYQDGFDPKEYERQIHEQLEQYCNDVMDEVNRENDDKENTKMDKIIGGKKCQQVKGYWLPVIETGANMAKIAMVKRGEIPPAKYIKDLGLDPDEYKVSRDDHITMRLEKDSEDKDYEKLNHTSLQIIGLSHQTTPTFVDKYIGDKAFKNGIYFPVSVDEFLSFDNSMDINKEFILDNVKKIINLMKRDRSVSHTFFSNDTFFVKRKLMKDEVEKYLTDIKRNNTKKTDPENFNDITVKDPIEASDDEISSFNKRDELIQNTGDVDILDGFNDNEDEFEPKVSHTLTFAEVSQLDTTTVNDQECVIYEGYAIPINLINNYWNGKMFELPELGTIFEENGLDPKLFDLVSENNAVDTIDVPDLSNMISIEHELLEICDKSGYNEKGYAAVSSDDIKRLANAIINVLDLGDAEYDETEIIEMINTVDDVAIFMEHDKQVYQVRIIGKEKKLTKEEKLLAFVNSDDVSNLYNPLEIIFDDETDNILDAINEARLSDDNPRIKDVAMNEHEENVIQSVIYTISLLPFMYSDIPEPCDHDIHIMVSTFINGLKHHVKEYVNNISSRNKISDIIVQYIILAYNVINYIGSIDDDDIKNELIYGIDDLSTYSSAATDDFIIDNDIIDFMRYKLETWFNPDDSKPAPDDEETVSSILKKTVNEYAVDNIVSNALLLSNNINLDLGSLKNVSLEITIPAHEHGNGSDEDLVVDVDLYAIITKNIKALKPGTTNHLK